MPQLVIAYPSLGLDAYQWIQQIRAEHDPQYPLVDPHFTLVFPTTLQTAAELHTHVQRCTADLFAFAVALRCATPVKDSFSPHTHVFLVPDAGNSALIRFHDALYRGPLAAELRLDVAYIPHITIASFTEPAAAKRLADRLNQVGVDIHGRIDTLHLISVEGGALSHLAEYPLMP